jgi:P-loop containing NTP hydrolase pore-1
VTAKRRADAKRDLEDVGFTDQDLMRCTLEQVFKGALTKRKKKAVMVFVTYSQLARKDNVVELVKKLGGKSFQGCLLFDECHMVCTDCFTLT